MQEFLEVPWLQAIWQRVAPAEMLDGHLTAQGAEWWVLGVIALAVGATVLSPSWRLLRVAVTLVHELGHAFIGVLVGRRFTGFVLRGDMSGHAVTVGKPTGAGRVVTTWAGYPAPAVVGAALVQLGIGGWSGLTLAVVGVLLALSFVRVRSVLTFVVVVGALLGVGALWWWRDDVVQAGALLGVGSLLILGAWRHLGAVLRSRDGGSDPSVLARLTRVPRAAWNATFVLVCALSTVVVGAAIWSLVAPV